jgi:hypothetical protein
MEPPKRRVAVGSPVVSDPTARTELCGQGKHCRGQRSLDPREGRRKLIDPRPEPEMTLRRASWLPCIICGDPDGWILPGGHRPVRRRLERLGLKGEACSRCYTWLISRKRKGLPLEPERQACRPVKPRGRRKPSARFKNRVLPACAICGDPAGPLDAGRLNPARCNLRRLGLEGQACRRCYIRLKDRKRRGLPLEPERLTRRPAQPKPTKVSANAVLPPCAVCSDPAGGRRKGAQRPARHDLRKFGVDGLGCQRCCVRLKSRVRLGLVVDPYVVLPRGRRRALEGRRAPAKAPPAPGRALPGLANPPIGPHTMAIASISTSSPATASSVTPTAVEAG